MFCQQTGTSLLHNPCAQEFPNLAHIPLSLWGDGTGAPCLQIEEGTFKPSLILPGKATEITVTQLNARMLLPRSQLLCFQKQWDKKLDVLIFIFPVGGTGSRKQ